MASTLICDKCQREVDEVHDVVDVLQSPNIKELCKNCLDTAGELHKQLAETAMGKVHDQVKAWLAETHH